MTDRKKIDTRNPDDQFVMTYECTSDDHDECDGEPIETVCGAYKCSCPCHYGYD